MSWSGLGANQIPTEDDLEDACTNDYLQGGFLALDNFRMVDAAVVESNVTGDGNLADDQRGPSKSLIEGWRLWDPQSDIPSGLSGVENTGIGGGINWSWTKDAGVPTVDGSWARNQLSVTMEIHTNSSFTNLFDTVNGIAYGTEAFSWTDMSATPGTRYYARIRYYNETDTSMVGSWEEDTTGAIYGDGGPS